MPHKGWIIAASLVAACASVNAEPAAKSERAHAMTMADHAPHIVTVRSNQDFTATLEAAQAAIDARGFRTFAVIDHAAGAASIDADLRPTTLIIFGNPRGGTPLMQAEQRMGLQLPLKLLVFEDADGEVHLVYPDMAHTFHEYGIAALSGPLSKIDGTLAAIAAEAAQM
ncbi:MAG: DUF302 domain-containing protein [Hyphococcus sp.]